MVKRPFDLASFYVEFGIAAKERSALRQDLVRGLRDYVEGVYGYDRYGAETVLQLQRYLHIPLVFGYAASRVLADRRLSDAIKVQVALKALDMIDYGADGGIPHAFYRTLHYLSVQAISSSDDLRYGLVVSAGEQQPFRGLSKTEALAFFRTVTTHADFPPAERAFWGHTLLARHGDGVGCADLIDHLVSCESLDKDDRLELCRAWIAFRQPRFQVVVPEQAQDDRSRFVAEHMPFWVAHVPSWPSHSMVRLGLAWLARLGEDPSELAERYVGCGDPYAEQFQAAVAEIIREHGRDMRDARVRSLLDRGIGGAGSSSARRRFYNVGFELYGPEYLHRATSDTASSVRQWAAKQLEKRT